LVRNTTAEIVAALEAAHPDWQVWCVHRVYGGPVYCARRWDGSGDVLNADTPEHLSEQIREAKQGD